MVAFGVESGPAGLAVRVQCQKGSNLLFEQLLLDGHEELLGFSNGQTQMLDTLRVLLQGGDVRHSSFLAILGAHDELKFGTLGGAPPVGVVYRCMA
jgi:hypothetical protein